MARLRHTGTLATIVCVAALLVVPPVSAHEEGSVAVTAVVETVPPAIAGVSVRTLRSVAPLLEIRNDTEREVLVLGVAGEPMVRLGRGGVEANLASPTYVAAATPFGATGAGAASAPQWHRVGEGAIWRGFDPRLRDVEAGRFRVPLVVGGEAATVEGVVVAGEVGHFVTTIAAPDDPSLDVRVFEGVVPALYVRNRGDEVLEIDGVDGEPYLRIGPGGVVGNASSMTFATYAERPDLTGGWVVLSDRPAWTWLEPRARLPGRGIEPVALGAWPATALTWTTPMRLGGRDVSVTGKVTWVPVAHPSSADPLSFALVTVGLGALAWRRTQRREAPVGASRRR